MGIAFDNWATNDLYGVTSGTFSGGSIYVSSTTTGYVTNGPPPAPTKPGPLAWLDERVDEIEEMGRELLEAA